MTQDSSSKEKDNKEIDFKKAMELLKDPQMLASAAAFHGFKLQAPGSERKEDKEEDIVPPADLEIPDEVTSKDLLLLIQKQMKANNDYLLKHLDRTSKSVDKKISGFKYEQQASEVARFVKTHKHAGELLPDMNAFWKSGDTLDEAYEKAKKLKGIVEEGTPKEKGKDKTETTPKEKPSIKSPRISEETGDEDNLEKVAPKSIEDSARSSLDEMIANNPDVARVISEDAGMDIKK